MDFDIPEFLTAERSMWAFFLCTLMLGGGAAWLSGRAIALTWRPWWHIVAYMLMLGFAVRFIHFALFDAPLLSLHYYLVDTTVCMLLGFLGFRVTRAAQMATQYRFLYRRRGLLSWRRADAPLTEEAGGTG